MLFSNKTTEKTDRRTKAKEPRTRGMFFSKRGQSPQRGEMNEALRHAPGEEFV